MAVNSCGNTLSGTFSFTTANFIIFCNTYTPTNLPLAVPPTGTSGTTVSNLLVNRIGNITSVKVKNLDITHTYIGDLDIDLTSPEGTTIRLISTICSSSDNMLINFDDESSNGYSAIPCPPTDNGFYQPYELFSAFAGENMNGTWTLTIIDNYGGDSGSLNNWELEICNESDRIGLALNVILEGPYNVTNMNSDLASDIPLEQPYIESPWNYNGTESVVSASSDHVDWVLVESRDAPDAASATSGTMIEQQAAFLLNDGSIVGLDGLSLLSFNHSIIQSLFVVIWHRNHLGVISQYPLTGSAGIYSYDFTTQADQVLGNLTGYKEIASGIYGLVGGDGNADGWIDSLDKLNVWEVQSGNAGYIMGDYNLNGQVTNKDKNDIYINNETKNDQVPD